ncbi:hypothetical protein BH18GEM1_BH18GEM1_13210 [soil metagenome]
MNLPGFRLLLLAVLTLGGSLDASLADAQQPGSCVSIPALRPGPTREARAVTARTLSRELPAAPILPRYSAFERTFAADFGFPMAGPEGLEEREDLLQELRTWAVSRWGETTFYSWVERALVAYAQIEASTRFEKKGFNMDVEVNDMAEGKLGVRVSRELAP